MKNTIVLLAIIVVFISCKKVDTPDNSVSYSCVIFQGTSPPAVNDSIQYFIDTTIFQSVINGGKGVVWNFTGLKQEASLTSYFGDKTAVKNSSLFPTADYVSTLNNERVYLALNSSGIEVQGAVVTISDTQFVAVYNKAYNHYDFPLSYNEGLTSNYAYKDTKYELVIDINGTATSADSLDISRTGTITKKVDGCGTLKMPTGTYEVLRVYKEETISDTAIAYVFQGIGTKPITVIEKETIFRTYEFVTDSFKAPVVIIELDENKQAEIVRFIE